MPIYRNILLESFSISLLLFVSDEKQRHYNLIEKTYYGNYN